MATKKELKLDFSDESAVRVKDIDTETGTPSEHETEPLPEPQTELVIESEPADPEVDNEFNPDEETEETQDSQEVDNQLAGIVEALIFVSGDPVPVKRLVDVLEVDDAHIRAVIQYINNRYTDYESGLQIMEVAGGFQMRTRPVYSTYVSRYLERKKKVSLSGPALESLAIIAYKQPITRAEVEAIRGVAVDGVLKSLLDKRLIKVTGVKDVVGKPNLYGTTKHFLEYFGLNSLADLPPIEDITKTFSSGSIQHTGESSDTTNQDHEQETGAAGQPELTSENPA